MPLMMGEVSVDDMRRMLQERRRGAAPGPVVHYVEDGSSSQRVETADEFRERRGLKPCGRCRMWLSPADRRQPHKCCYVRHVPSYHETPTGVDSLFGDRPATGRARDLLEGAIEG